MIEQVNLAAMLAARAQEKQGEEADTGTQAMEQPAIEQELPKIEPVADWEGPVYKGGVFVSKLILDNGSSFKPRKDGLFYPETQEQIDMLDYFVSKGRAEKIK